MMKLIVIILAILAFYAFVAKSVKDSIQYTLENHSSKVEMVAKELNLD